MSFTNSQLAQKISNLIGYWSGFAEEYSNWLGGTANGGPGSDGRYPLTDWAGNESLVKSPAKLQADVDGQVSSASSHASAAAASASAASTSETNAAASASAAATSESNADADRIAAEAASTSASGSAVTATSQANLALTRANNAAASAAAALVSETNAAASEAAAAASAAAAATFDPANFYLRTALDGGQLDNRYYTESEVDASFAAETLQAVMARGASSTVRMVLQQGAGGAALEVDASSNWSTGTHNTPAIRFRQANGTIYGAIRASYNGTNYNMHIGTGWLTNLLTLSSSQSHSLAGSLTMTGGLITPSFTLNGTGILNTDVKPTGGPHGATYRRQMVQFNRRGVADDMLGNWDPGVYGGYSTMVNGPTGMTYDPFLVMGSSADVRSFLVVPRTGNRPLAWKGAYSSGTVHTAWQYSVWGLAPNQVENRLDLQDGLQTGNMTISNVTFDITATDTYYGFRGRSDSAGGIRLLNNSNAVRGYMYYNATHFGLLTATGGWSLQIDGNKNINIFGELVSNNGIATTGSVSDVGQVGPFAFMDFNGGVARIGGYDYDAGAWKDIQVSGYNVRLEAFGGKILAGDDIQLGLTGQNPKQIDVRGYSTLGGWARGFRGLTEAGTVLAGIGYLGTNDAIDSINLGFGSTWWGTANNGISLVSGKAYFDANIDFTAGNNLQFENLNAMYKNGSWLYINGSAAFTSGVYIGSDIQVNGTARFNGYPYYQNDTYGVAYLRSATYNQRGVDVWHYNNAASVTVDNWYTIASDPPGLDVSTTPVGKTGGSRAAARIRLWDLNSGEHGYVEFVVSCHYGRRPVITMTANSNYGDATSTIKAIRVVRYSTYNGVAIQVKAGSTGTMYCSVQRLHAGGFSGRDFLPQTPEATWFVEDVLTSWNGLTLGSMAYVGPVGGADSSDSLVSGMMQNGFLTDRVWFKGATNKDVYLHAPNIGNLQVQTEHGYLRVGPLNTTWCHYETDATGHYFYENVTSAVGFRPAANLGSDLGTASLAFNVAHLNTVELGGATDATLSRLSAGNVGVEGKALLRHAGAYTSGQVTISDTGPTGGANGDVWLEY